MLQSRSSALSFALTMSTYLSFLDYLSRMEPRNYRQAGPGSRYTSIWFRWQLPQEPRIRPGKWRIRLVTPGFFSPGHSSSIGLVVFAMGKISYGEEQEGCWYLTNIRGELESVVFLSRCGEQRTFLWDVSGDVIHYKCFQFAPFCSTPPHHWRGWGSRQAGPGSRYCWEPASSFFAAARSLSTFIWSGDFQRVRWEGEGKVGGKLPWPVQPAASWVTVGRFLPVFLPVDRECLFVGDEALCIHASTACFCKKLLSFKCDFWQYFLTRHTTATSSLSILWMYAWTSGLRSIFFWETKAQAGYWFCGCCFFLFANAMAIFFSWTMKQKCPANNRIMPSKEHPPFPRSPPGLAPKFCWTAGRPCGALPWTRPRRPSWPSCPPGRSVTRPTARFLVLLSTGKFFFISVPRNNGRYFFDTTNFPMENLIIGKI